MGRTGDRIFVDPGAGRIIKNGGDAMDINYGQYGAAWSGAWRPALERLQRLQDDRGRWCGGESEAARWVTLKATMAVLEYAVDAGLPRLFPQPPKR